MRSGCVWITELYEELNMIKRQTGAADLNRETNTETQRRESEGKPMQITTPITQACNG